MELSYKALEATLMGHLHIHPDKQATFRSRIKQLQRLKPGFPPGVNVGRGEKLTYTGTHLFQMVTAFELIGAGLPPQRAADLVTANWQCFAASYALAVQCIRRPYDRKTQIYAWVLSRSFHEIQVDPFPAKLSLSDCRDGSRVAIGDHDGISNELLKRIARRQAHCYALVPVSDLAWSMLNALETFGGYPRARFDPEFKEWLPQEGGDYSDWLFIYSFDPWEPEPEVEQYSHASTSEIQRRLDVSEELQSALYRYEEYRRQRDEEEEEGERPEPTPAMRRAAAGLVVELSEPAKRLLIEGPKSELATGDEDRDAMVELLDNAILVVTDDAIRITNLGIAVLDELVPSEGQVVDGEVVESRESDTPPTVTPLKKRA